MAALLSWGRYPHHPQNAHAPAWRDGIHTALADASRTHGTMLPFGNGRSYGDSCLAASDDVLRTLSLDRLISADWNSGVLRAESGITLERLLEVIIPRGWMLPITPGTKYATLGGALANDVHGKNHHVRGTFGAHVPRFMLARSNGSVLECPPQDHAELFAATIGGLGLMGVIVWAEIQLMPIRSSLIDTRSIRLAHLDAFFELSAQFDMQHEYGVAWIDCQARGAQLGRGLYMTGDHAKTGALQVDTRKKRTVPFTLPVAQFNRVTLRAFNALYYRRQFGDVKASTVSYDPFFYPLDSLLEWNRISGRAGFQQFQCVVPAAVACDAIRALLDAIAKSGTGSFLAVLKRCGGQTSPGLLSFPLEGTSLALDFPQRDAANARLFASLGAIVREAGGRLYPAKDAQMPGADFRAAYPRWQDVERHRDPAILSRFWQRTTQS
ncbi:Oxidoreductase, FAD-binding [Candidatus Burkholderia humilis]|nr:Oxidoreductase, FAD-binding [Candidatus Burkholderia humilis]